MSQKDKALRAKLGDIIDGMRTKAINNVTIKSSTLDRFADELDEIWETLEKEALEQPVQEPVAWTSTKALENAKRLKTADLWVEYDEEYDKQAKEIGWKSKQIPLYTHPAQPLSDDEIERLWKEFEKELVRKDIRDFTRAIEQAHGIKNEQE